MTDGITPARGLDLRCSTQSAEVGDSLLGTAGHDQHYLLVELPLPWPKSIEEHPLLSGVVLDRVSTSSGSTRILAILSDQPPSVDPHGGPVHRLISYRGGDGTRFSHFDRYEGFVRRADLGGVISDVLAGDLGDLDLGDDGLTDVLICTHGTRDRCCGQEGARLFLELAASDLDHARFWRTSHTGGHRFAPIALTFPDGYTWGRITSADILGILDHGLEPDTLIDKNRGCMGFADPESQVADSLALAASGWDWLASERSTRIRTASADTVPGNTVPGSAVIVEIGNDHAAFEVTVSRGAPVPVPACGEPIDAAKKTTIPRFAVAVDRVGPGTATDRL